MTTRGAVFCALSVAVLLLDQGCWARTNCSSESGISLQTKVRLYLNSSLPCLAEQSPRFVAMNKGRTVNIQCGCGMELYQDFSVSWYLGSANGSVISYLRPDNHFKMSNNSLTIRNVQKKDNGIYFCEYRKSKEIRKSRCGTELMVVGCGNREVSKARNTIKDAIIAIQSVLIVLFILVPITLLREMKKTRTLKIEDHTYEGLEAYQAATYEDIQNVRVLAAKTMEGEHPCLE